jgi:hypothetical protein
MDSFILAAESGLLFSRMLNRVGSQLRQIASSGGILPRTREQNPISWTKTAPGVEQERTVFDRSRTIRVDVSTKLKDTNTSAMYEMLVEISGDS